MEVGLGLYYAAKADAWALGSTTNSIFAVASAASSGGLLLCLALMLWRKFQGQPVTDSLATPVMLLAEGLYHNDQCLLDSAAILLPIQSVAIAVLWMAVSVIGATNVDLVVLAIIWYYCFAVLCLATMLFKDRRGSNRFVGPRRIDTSPRPRLEIQMLPPLHSVARAAAQTTL